MNYYKYSLLFIVLSLTFNLATSTPLFAKDTAKGNLKVDDTTATLNHAYFDKYDDEFTIIITDNPVEPDAVPYGITELSEQAKVRALKFTVNRKSNELMMNRGKAIYFHPTWDRIVNIGKPELKITTFDENKLVGSIKTTSENEYDGHKFSYDISFDLSLIKEIPKLTFTGKKGPQVDAYSLYCKSIMESNIEEFKKYLPSENLQYLPPNNEDMILGLEFVRDTMMTDMEVTDIKTSGDKADLIIKGSRGSSKSNGKVTMLNENGAWKVFEESWKLSE